MSNGNLHELSALFQGVAEAHHRAFIETDGSDKEWPLWYAEYLHPKLSRLLRARFTKSELVYLLVMADKEQNIDAPGADWKSYYSRFFIERYGLG